VTQVQGDASLGATITRRVLSASDCAGRPGRLAPELAGKGCDKNHEQDQRSVTNPYA